MFFFFNDTATTEIYTLSLHDALPITVVANSHAQIPNRHQKHSIRLFPLHRDGNARLRAGAGGFDPGAHSERAEHLRPRGCAAEDGTACPPWRYRLTHG